MTDAEAPRIEFPCDYPIKVICEAHEVIVDEVVAIALRHDPGLDRDKVSERPSRNGNYHAITLRFWATGKPQLDRLFSDLKECRAVRLVL